MPRLLAHRTLWPLLPSLAAALMLQAALTGCRGSAPEDLIQQETTTDAIVFVKSTGTETLNRSDAPSNLYKLSPIAVDGVEPPITNFAGAAISDPAAPCAG